MFSYWFKNEYILIKQGDLTVSSADPAILNPFKIIFFIWNLLFSVTRTLNWFVQNPFEKEIICSKQGHTQNGKRETLQMKQKMKNLFERPRQTPENRFSSSILILWPNSFLCFARKKQIILKSERTGQIPFIRQLRCKQTFSQVRILDKTCK